MINGDMGENDNKTVEIVLGIVEKNATYNSKRPENVNLSNAYLNFVDAITTRHSSSLRVFDILKIIESLCTIHNRRAHGDSEYEGSQIVSNVLTRCIKLLKQRAIL